MPPQGELARADLVRSHRRSAQRGTRSGGATPSSFYSLFVSERRTLQIDRAAITRRPGSISSSIGAIGGTLRPGIGQKEVTCGFIR